jgi:multiple antibiotic resistance protein
MQDIISLLSKQYAALFSIINPLGSALIFFAITRALPVIERAQLAGRVGFFAWGTLIVSYFGGLYLLQFFGLSISILRVAGGIVVALAAWDMLNYSEDQEKNALPAVAKGRDAIAFYPLTMPLTVGPGSISVAIALATDAPSQLKERFLLSAAVAIVTITLISATIYFCYRYADRLTRVLGKTGSIIIERMSGFLLFCIGIQIIWLGARGLILSIQLT